MERAVERLFRCSKCGSALELERVISAAPERKAGAVTGYVVFHHWCTCTDGSTRATRSWGTHQAFVALFGSQPWLPYRAPFGHHLLADDDPRTSRWQWELDQMRDVEEFLLFLDDARARQSGS